MTRAPPRWCCWAGPTRAGRTGRLNAVFRALLGGVPLVAMQQNRWWPTADGPALDAGMFVVGLSYAAAAEPVVVGKPSTEIYRSACRLLGVDPAEAMMVGDDPESDLAPAAGIGMRTCLVRTGKGSSFGEHGRRPRSGRPGGAAGGAGRAGLAPECFGGVRLKSDPDRWYPARRCTTAAPTSSSPRR